MRAGFHYNGVRDTRCGGRGRVTSEEDHRAVLFVWRYLPRANVRVTAREICFADGFWVPALSLFLILLEWGFQMFVFLVETTGNIGLNAVKTVEVMYVCMYVCMYACMYACSSPWQRFGI